MYASSTSNRLAVSDVDIGLCDFLLAYEFAQNFIASFFRFSSTTMTFSSLLPDIRASMFNERNEEVE